MSQIILCCTCFSSDQQAYTLYYIHFKITDDPSNLIGSQQCGLFTNRTIFFFVCALNHICSKLHHFCSKSDQFCSISHHFCCR